MEGERNPVVVDLNLMVWTLDGWLTYLDDFVGAPGGNLLLTTRLHVYGFHVGK